MPSHAPATSASTPVPAKKRQQSVSRPSKYAVNRLIENSLTLPRIQERGLTHPQNGGWLMLPPEFDAIFAYEIKAVVQVVLVIIRKTIGVVGDGPYDRGLWMKLSVRKIAAEGHMHPAFAQRGLKLALEKGYLKRRLTPTKRWEYSIRWRGIED
jgi:hypothetical protein